MPLMIGGGWLGAWAFRRFGTRSYRPLALGALLVTAAASIARAVVDLF
jgi:Ni/Fe-hydrogenase subunit HybB-like protein